MNAAARILGVTGVLLVSAVAPAQTSALYLNEWFGEETYVVQNGLIVRQWTRRDTQDGPGLVVVDSIKNIGVRVGNVGREYDLNGNLLGGRYTNPGFHSLYDGATDGQRNWSIGVNDRNTNYALVEGDADWGNLQVLFVPQTRSLGITYDGHSGTLWVGADAPGGITHVEQYDLNGNKLFDFPLQHTERSYALAWDPADDTLWIPTFATGGQLFQYDKQGNLLQRVTVPGMQNAAIAGAEFQIPEPSAAVLLSLGGVWVARRRR